jgi:hypothetical protein
MMELLKAFVLRLQLRVGKVGVSLCFPYVFKQRVKQSHVAARVKLQVPLQVPSQATRLSCILCIVSLCRLSWIVDFQLIVEAVAQSCACWMPCRWAPSSRDYWRRGLLTPHARWNTGKTVTGDGDGAFTSSCVVCCNT